MAKLNRSLFKFRKHDTIGSEGAEEDGEFLLECFVETGDLTTLRSLQSLKSIVVGRTGAGKTALLTLLSRRESNVASIEPQQLSLQYLANSTILRRLEELGVDLDLFYRLLWRHVLAVELIQLRYRLHSEQDQKNFLERIRERFFGDKKKNDALDYLVEWGQRFWEDPELRVHEVTRKLEDDVRSRLGVKARFLEMGTEEGAAFSVEDRQEIAHHAQEVVNAVQIAKLTNVIRVLAEDVFDDPQQHFFVLIDRLDEHWVADPLRYRLIRSLLEAVRDLRAIRTAKVVVALRKDLLDRLIRHTRDSGFQEEKYQPYFLRLEWTKAQLLEVLDRRLNLLVQRHYSGTAVGWRDVFPGTVNREPTEDYLFARSHARPRDIIQFANCCIELATDKPEVTASIVRAAEANYSTMRFRSLADEWAADYPRLLDIAGILRGRPPNFTAEQLSDLQIEEIALRMLDFQPIPGDRVYGWSTELIEGHVNTAGFRSKLIRLMFDVGLVGVKLDPTHSTLWSFLSREVLRDTEVQPGTRIEICPMYHRVLAVRGQQQ